jgi:predicted DNA-binding protein (UPF0251 family)
MGASDNPTSPHSRRTDALRQLPAAYSRALRLRDTGLPEDLMAERLGIEPEALDAFLEIAEAKLATILIGERGA